MMSAGAPTGVEKARAQYKQPPPFEEYAADIMADPRYVAVVGKDLSFAAPLELPSSKRQPRLIDVKVSKLDAEQICFAYEMVGVSIKLTTDEIAQSWKARLDEHHFTVRAIKSLEAERGRPLFPVPAGGSSIKTSEVVTDEVRDVDNRERGTVERKRFVELRYCAQLPPITSETKFLAITLHDPDPEAPEYEGLYDMSKEADERANENNRRSWMAGDALFLISIGGPP